MNAEADLLRDKVVFITGRTGSFGKQFLATVLKDHAPRKLIVFSRDELKQPMVDRCRIAKTGERHCLTD